MLAEFGAIHVEQQPAMFAFLGRHFRKHFRRAGIIPAQPFGEVGVDAAVLLLVRDREGEHFLLAQFIKIPHVGLRRCTAT